MTLNIAICDDEQIYIRDLQTCLNRYDVEHNIDLQISTFHTGKDLLSYYTNHTIDVVFLDIEMPDMNGMDVARTFRDQGDHNISIVFVSNYPEFMQGSFEVMPTQYLCKPVKYDDIVKVMDRLIRFYIDSHKTLMVVQKNDTDRIVYVQDIIYLKVVKGSSGEVMFVTKNETFLATGTMVEYEELLSDSFFASPYRGYLVNMAYIHYFKDNTITLTTGEVLPISRRRIKDIKSLFMKRIITFMQ